MNKEDFIEHYNNWTNEKLVESFKNRKDFQPVAVEAMLVVMKERKLNTVAENIISEDRKTEIIQFEKQKLNLEFEQKRYEENFLKTTLDDVSFAKNSKDKDGIYTMHTISAGKGIMWRTSLFSLITVSVLIFIFGFTIKPLFKNAQEISGGLSVFMIVYVVYLIYAARAKFSLTENVTRKTVFELVHGNKTFTATVPFKYTVYAGEMEMRSRGITVTHPLLYLFIENQSGEKIGLLENLTALQDAPPAWPPIASSPERSGTAIYKEVPFEKIQLIRLKKILDGLHNSKPNS
jgi:hypothetical protein